MKVTESIIQNRLARMFRFDGGLKIIVPNAVMSWGECDLLTMTKAGYLREYEIKLSKADFLADRKKRHDVRIEGARFSDWKKNYKEMSKLEWLASEYNKSVKEFTYVISGFEIEEYELPDYAGLMVFNPDSWQISEIRAPKKLGGKKADERLQIYLLQKCMYRMLDNMARWDDNAYNKSKEGSKIIA